MKFWEKISLAHLRYAKVHSGQGGPITKLTHRESLRLGEKVHEAFATLATDIMPRSQNQSNLYGKSHGTGTSFSRTGAIYRAISEALERWAWFESGNSPALHNALRFDIDDSTTGFAAYPGIMASSSRVNALYEAAERWSINAWWQERVGQRDITDKMPWPNVNGVEILAPFANCATALVWADVAGLRAYGFASGAHTQSASLRAAVELGRNIQVLEYFLTVRGSPAGNPYTRNERRLLFFASDAGKNLFDRRLHKWTADTPTAPKLLVDQPVIGPWTKYTHVWRCLFDPAGLHDTGTDDYFHF